MHATKSNEMDGRNTAPKSVAIAGAWGYIGRKFLDAAVALDAEVFIHDPGPTPSDLDTTRFTQVDSEEEFYALPAEVFHLALHPRHRRYGTEVLIERCRTEPLLVLCEKPMAAPQDPEDCRWMVSATKNLDGLFLYDFPELYDPLTRRIEDYLSRFEDVRIDEIYVSRSKDREDPTNRRNDKLMVSIQYQESVHCLAFALHLLGKVHGSLSAAMKQGLSVTADAEPYDPPNPTDYPYMVDGRCRFAMSIGATKVTGDTNFKAGAKWTKRRRISGSADGKPFSIDAEYLEGHKRCVIDGVDQQCGPADDSYRQVLLRAGAWQRNVARDVLLGGMFPNPRFAQTTYQLSSVLWRSCTDRAVVELRSFDDLLQFDAGFRAEIAKMPRYGR